MYDRLNTLSSLQYFILSVSLALLAANNGLHVKSDSSLLFARDVSTHGRGLTTVDRQVIESIVGMKNLL